MTISLSEMPSQSEGRLAKCNPRREAGGTISWDLDLAFDIMRTEDAEIVDRYVPGTLDQWNAGQRGSIGSAKATSGFDIVRATISFAGDQLAAGHSEIKQCITSVKGETAVVTLKLRMHDLIPRAAAALAYALDEIVDVKIESRQGVMYGSQEKEKQIDHDNLMDKLVNGQLEDGTSVTGLVVGVEGQDLLVTVLKSAKNPLKMKVSTSKIASLEIFVGEREKLDDILGTYESSCVGGGIDPNWDDIVEAIGLLYAEGKIESRADFQWEVSKVVIERAVELGVTKEYGDLGI